MTVGPQKENERELRPLLDSEATARYLGVSVATLANWSWRGFGPRHVKVGSRRMYSPDDLVAWVEERKSA